MPEPWFSDTTPEALETYVHVYRNMTQAQRLARVFELCELQQALQEANIRACYPHAGERELFLRAASRRLPRELMIKAYGWDPELHP